MKKGKRLMAILLSVGMVLTTGPGVAFALEGTDENPDAATLGSPVPEAAAEVKPEAAPEDRGTPAADAADREAPAGNVSANQTESGAPSEKNAEKDKAGTPEGTTAQEPISGEGANDSAVKEDASPGKDASAGKEDAAGKDAEKAKTPDQTSADRKGEVLPENKENDDNLKNSTESLLADEVEGIVVSLMGEENETSGDGEEGGNAEPEPVEEEENDVQLFDGEKEITVTAKSVERTYDGTEYTMEGLISDTFTVDGETYTVEGLTASVTATDAGSYPCKVTGTPVVKDSEGADVTEQFTVSTVPGTLTIGKRAVTLTSTSKTKEYDGEVLIEDEVTIGGAGFVGSDGVNVTFPHDVGQSEVGETDNYFNYSWTAGTNGNNYTVTTSYGKLTVTARTITIAGNSDEVTYDGQEHSVEGYTVENAGPFTIQGISAQVSGTDAREYPNVITGTETVIGTDGQPEALSNFVIQHESGMLTIKKAEATVAITGRSASHEYDGEEHSVKGYSARIEGSELYRESDFAFTPVSGVTLEGGDPVAKGTETGEYPMGLTPDCFINNNENFTVTFDVTDGVLTITGSTAKIIVTSKSGSKTYDGTPLTEPEVTITGVPEGFTASATAAGSVTNVDDTDTTNRITGFVIRDGSGKDVTSQFPNVTTVAGKLTIEPRKVTLTSQSGSMLYEEGITYKLPEVTIGGDGFVAGEATAEAIGEATEVGVPVTNIIRINPGANYNEHNYDITKNEGTLILKHREEEIFLIAGSAYQTYNGKALTDEEVIAIGLPEGATYTAKAEGSQTDAGTSTNKVAAGYKVTGRTGEDITGSLDITVIDGTLTVTRRTVIVRSASESKEYDGTPLTSDEWDVTGLIDGDDQKSSIDVTITGTQTDCGTSPNTITCDWAADPGFNTGNYKLSALPGELEVTENTGLITIWADDRTKKYDGKPFSPLTYRVTGNLPAGMSVRTEVECEDPNFTGLGSIETWVQETPGSATGWNVTIWNDNENKDVTEYFKHIAVVDGTLTIEPAPVIVKADNKSKYVDADDPELTATVTGLVGDETVAYTLSREAGEGVGRYTITPTGEKNQGHYEVTFETGTFTINRAGGGSSGGNGGEDPKPDEPLIYTLTYDDGTGTVTENYPEGTTVTLTRTPTRDGYRFTGWYTDPDLTNRVTRVTVGEDTTLYAGWEELKQEESRTVTFDDGTTKTSRQVAAGSTIRLTETPTRDGYRFTGWYTDPEKTNRVTRVTVDNDLTLYAGWEKINSGGNGGDNNNGNNNGSSGNKSSGRTGRTVTPSTGSGNGSGTNGAPGGTDISGGTDIEDEEPPTTDGTDGTDGTEIKDDEVPKAWDDGQWALVNLILAILSMLLGAGTLAGWFRRKHEERLAGLVTAITSLVVFLVTEDLTQPMCLTDKWTPLMALILGAAAAAAFVPGKKQSRR